jgi:phospholipase/carboxylesterase
MIDSDPPADPHADQGVVSAGAPRGAAEAVVVALHGRGATAQGVANLADPLAHHGVTVVAPEAERSRWWPYDTSGPIERNEPHVSSAVRVVDRVLDDIADWGVEPERVVLFGFSQGASLACEYVARHPQRYGGVAAFAGGLLGPAVADRAFEGSLDGTPVLLGWGRDDDRVDPEQLRATARVLEQLGGTVTEREYAGVGHAVTDDALDAAGDLVADLLADGR